MSPPILDRQTTVGDLLQHLSPDLLASSGPPPWPPNAFALAASILYRSGGYRSVVVDWPPAYPAKTKSWQAWIEDVGQRWRKGWPDRRIPVAVRTWWRTLDAHRDVPLAAVCEIEDLSQALVQLCAAADTACAGVGLPPLGEHSRLWWDATRNLQLSSKSNRGATLCDREILSWTVRVLPKFHTPQSGITIRSLSHHLALCPAEEVVPGWHFSPPRRGWQRSFPRILNLLVIPWPKEIRRRQFQPTRPSQGELRNMDRRFRFFMFDKPSAAEEISEELGRIYDLAVEEAGFIDLIVLPELALDDREFKAARQWAKDQDVLLICGVGSPPPPAAAGENAVVFTLPGSSDPIRQPKHHRWQLDRSQIETYGLGGYLDPEKQWWEKIAVSDRSLKFISLSPWLNLCVLVCEDLAQQEPVARMVRAVGPNLVIAVLMDGPQLASRWPARYATVLTDDPGSSVLTLTSLGMCERSRPPGYRKSRVIALWNDTRARGAREIEIGKDAEGVVLNLLVEKTEEFTADGRSDHEQAGRPVLVGAYDVKAR